MDATVGEKDRSLKTKVEAEAPPPRENLGKVGSLETNAPVKVTLN